MVGAADMVPGALFTTSRSSGDAATIALRGELDLQTLPHLEQTYAALLRTGARRITVDLRGMTFMDSTALHAFSAWDLAAQAAPGRSLDFVRAPATVQRLFLVAGLGERFTFRDEATQQP